MAGAVLRQAGSEDASEGGRRRRWVDRSGSQPRGRGAGGADDLFYGVWLFEEEKEEHSRGREHWRGVKNAPTTDRMFSGRDLAWHWRPPSSQLSSTLQILSLRSAPPLVPLRLRHSAPIFLAGSPAPLGIGTSPFSNIFVRGDDGKDYGMGEKEENGWKAGGEMEMEN
ncbi:hypothetical protein BT69DRAFT_1319453 [Atractiella rhizophila]|nr:hypothetical protein BT69DRAFT_1319453 [Atractiella rhizophila]